MLRNIRLKGKTIKFRVVFFAIIIVMMVELFSGVGMFFFVKKITMKNTEAQMNEMMSQILIRANEKIDEIMNQFNSLESDYDFIVTLSEYNEKTLVENSVKLANIMSKITNNSKIIDSIYYIRSDDNIFSEFGLIKSEENGLFNELISDNHGDINEYIRWSAPYQSDYFHKNNKNLIGLSKKIKIKNVDAGVLIFNVNIDYLISEVFRFTYLSDSVICIINENGEIMTKLQNEDVRDNILSYAQRKNFERPLIKDGFLYFNQPMFINGWRLVAAVSTNEVFSNEQYIWVIIAILILTGALFTGIVIFYFINDIVSPIKKIEKIMLVVQKNNMDARIDKITTEREDELGSLARSCNDMLNSMNSLMQREKKEIEMRAEAELSMFQHQINAHFLYNTLNSISSKVMCGDIEKSYKMIEMLAQHFRLMFKSGRNVAKVEEELQYVMNYIELEQYKTDRKIVCMVDVDLQLYSKDIPVFILQPLVENSILHGLYNSDKEWQINITGRYIGDCMIYTVEDNGAGFINENIDDEIKNRNPDGANENSALRNIYQRIKTFGGENGDMFLYNRETGGACVELVLPVKTEV